MVGDPLDQPSTLEADEFHKDGFAEIVPRQPMKHFFLFAVSKIPRFLLNLELENERLSGG